jgi:endonuclease/exonuclease/phosphatase family metal-dependent hydrolase
MQGVRAMVARHWVVVLVGLVASCAVDSQESRGYGPQGELLSHSQRGVTASSELERIGCEATQLPSGYSLVCPETVLCADNEDPRPLGIRIASWNIKVGSIEGLDAITAALLAIDADVIMLQEVDVDVARTGVVDQPREIANALGHQYAFAPTVALEGGTYGIAMLSRLPYQFVGTVPLTNAGAAEPRTAIEAHLCIGASELRVINHHADYTLAAAETSVLELADYISDEAQLGALPTLFGGDFNQEPTDRGLRACVDAGLVDVLAEFDPAPTRGSRRIDYVFAKACTAAWILAAEVVSSSASDHQALVVDLELPSDDPE